MSSDQRNVHGQIQKVWNGTTYSELEYMKVCFSGNHEDRSLLYLIKIYIKLIPKDKYPEQRISTKQQEQATQWGKKQAKMLIGISKNT